MHETERRQHLKTCSIPMPNSAHRVRRDATQRVERSLLRTAPLKIGFENNKHLCFSLQDCSVHRNGHLHRISAQHRVTFFRLLSCRLRLQLRPLEPHNEFTVLSCFFCRHHSRWWNFIKNEICYWRVQHLQTPTPLTPPTSHLLGAGWAGVQRFCHASPYSLLWIFSPASPYNNPMPTHIDPPLRKFGKCYFLASKDRFTSNFIHMTRPWFNPRGCPTIWGDSNPDDPFLAYHPNHMSYNPQTRRLASQSGWVLAIPEEPNRPPTPLADQSHFYL